MNREESKFKTWCDSQGLFCLKLRLYESKGFPDRTVIGPGFVCFFEFKRPGESTSDHQHAWAARLRDKGFFVWTVTSCDAAIEWLDCLTIPTVTTWKEIRCSQGNSTSKTPRPGR